jgi:hypothetical protein
LNGGVSDQTFILFSPPVTNFKPDWQTGRLDKSMKRGGHCAQKFVPTFLAIEWIKERRTVCGVFEIDFLAAAPHSLDRARDV